jgi:hypothetical protein
MKKALLILLAFALVFGLVFTGCPNGSTKGPTGPIDPPVDPNLQDFVVDEGIELKYCGNNGKAEHVNGNKFILNGQDGLDNVGFYWEFPEEVVGKGYGAINIEMEVISISSPNFIGFMTYSKSDFSGPVKVIDKDTGQQKTGEYDHEFKLGVECVKGATGDTAEGGDGIVDGSSAAEVKRDVSYPFAKFTDRIAFQVNKYAENITTPNWDQKATFTIAVTKVTFVGGAVADTIVDEKAIPGIIAPAAGLVPVTTVGSSSQYAGTVAWAGTLDGAGKFVLGTAYTATITLEAKEGFTLTGVAANFFTVEGATTVTNAKDSGVVTAVFPAAQAPAQEIVLFDLAAWLAGPPAQADGAITGNLKDPLVKAGSPTVTVDGGKLVISGRSGGTWEGIDIKVDGFTFDYANYDYTLTVTGYTNEANANGLKAGQTGSPYNEIGHINTDGTTTTSTFTKPVPEKDSGGANFGNIRINSDVAQATGSYTLTSVILKGVEK